MKPLVHVTRCLHFQSNIPLRNQNTYNNLKQSWTHSTIRQNSMKIFLLLLGLKKQLAYEVLICAQNGLKQKTVVFNHQRQLCPWHDWSTFPASSPDSHTAGHCVYANSFWNPAVLTAEREAVAEYRVTGCFHSRGYHRASETERPKVITQSESLVQ